MTFFITCFTTEWINYSISYFRTSLQSIWVIFSKALYDYYKGFSRNYLIKLITRSILFRGIMLLFVYSLEQFNVCDIWFIYYIVLGFIYVWCIYLIYKKNKFNFHLWLYPFTILTLSLFILFIFWVLFSFIFFKVIGIVFLPSFTIFLAGFLCFFELEMNPLNPMEYGYNLGQGDGSSNSEGGPSPSGGPKPGEYLGTHLDESNETQDRRMYTNNSRPFRYILPKEGPLFEGMTKGAYSYDMPNDIQDNYYEDYQEVNMPNDIQNNYYEGYQEVNMPNDMQGNYLEGYQERNIPNYPSRYQHISGPLDYFVPGFQQTPSNYPLAQPNSPVVDQANLFAVEEANSAHQAAEEHAW